MRQPALTLGWLLLACAAATMVAAEQPQEHYGVDSIVPEDDAVHHAIIQGDTPATIKKAPVPEAQSAMQGKVLALLKGMIKQQGGDKQALIEKKPTAIVHEAAPAPVPKKTVQKATVHSAAAPAKPTVAAKAAKAAPHASKKMTNKVMQLLAHMQKQAAAAEAAKKQRKQHTVVKAAPKPKKVAAPKPKKVVISHVKNGLQMLQNMVHATEDAAAHREALIAKKAKEASGKKKKAALAKQKKKVDPLEAALSEASEMMASQDAKEMQKKKAMADSLKDAQQTAEEQQDVDYDDDDDDLPPAPPTLQVQSLKPAKLSEKGKSLLANLMKEHDEKEKAAADKLKKAAAAKKAKLDAKKAAKKAKLEAKKAHEKRIRDAKMAIVNKRNAKVRAEQAQLSALGTHASSLPHRSSHKQSKSDAKAPKKHLDLVDQVLMRAMETDLDAKPSKAKKPVAKEPVVVSEEDDRLAEEEAFGRQVAASVHKESQTKAQRRKEEEDAAIRMRKRAEQRAKEQLAAAKASENADKKAGKMVKHEKKQLTHDVGLAKPKVDSFAKMQHAITAGAEGAAKDDDAAAAAIAAKLFKQLGGKAMKPEDLRAAVQNGLAKAQPVQQTSKAPKVAKVAKIAPKVAPKVAKVAKVAPKVATKSAPVLMEEEHLTAESLEIVKDLKRA